MSVQELISTYRPAYGETWERAVKVLTEDPIEAEIVDMLRQVLRDQGDFGTPIRLDDDGPGWGLRVGNGMHRIVAAILEGNAEVPVTHTYVPPDGQVEVEFCFTMDDAEPLWWPMSDALRSFPLDPAGYQDPSEWIETGFSRSGSRYRVWCECRPSQVLALGERVAQIVKGITGRAVTLEVSEM